MKKIKRAAFQHGAANKPNRKKRNSHRKERDSKGKRWLLDVAIGVCVAVMLFSGYQIYNILAERAAGEKINQEMTAHMQYENVETEGEIQKPGLTVDFEALQAENSDICAWIYLEDTPINYPVVQAEDNDYYLTRTASRKRNSCGAIFMDSRNNNDFSEKKTIIYGHRMNNGSMFAELLEYRSQEYYEAHPYALLATPEQMYVLHIFAAQEVADDWDNYNLTFADEDAFLEDIAMLQENNYLQNDIVVKEEDQVVALSTCVRGDSSKRFLVLAKLVPHEEFDFSAPLG